jgi:hypothetical protein
MAFTLANASTYPSASKGGRRSRKQRSRKDKKRGGKSRRDRKSRRR